MIDLENSTTFPSKLLEYVNRFGRDIVAEYKRHEEAVISVEGRWNPPDRYHYDVALDIAIRECKGQYIKGYHCTKVIDIENIRSKGLHITKAEQNIERFLKLCETHPLLRPHKNDYKYHLSNWLSDNQIPSRNNKLWFCLFDVVVNPFGCEDFFKYYGGEIIRWHLKKEKELMKPLEKIGVPIVVVARLQISKLGLHGELGIGENVLNKAIKDLVEKKHHYQKIETYIEKDLVANDILEINALPNLAFSETQT